MATKKELNAEIARLTKDMRQLKADVWVAADNRYLFQKWGDAEAEVARLTEENQRLREGRDSADTGEIVPTPHTPPAEFWSDPCPHCTPPAEFWSDPCPHCEALTQLTRDADGTYRIAFDPFRDPWDGSNGEWVARIANQAAELQRTYPHLRVVVNGTGDNINVFLCDTPTGGA